MFFFKGGQAVEKGTYWEPNEGRKVVLSEKGFLPAGKQWYYKLPESYLLIPLFLLALGLSMAFPYGIGVVIFGLLYVLFRVLFSLSCTFERLLGNLLAHLLVRYRPHISFFTGSKKRRKFRERKEKGEEE